MSRAYRFGNIYTRVESLIRKGHLEETGRPIWFDVYKQFPPMYDPTFNRVEPDIEVKKIFYKEDALRAKIHKAFKDNLGVFNLKDYKESFSQSLLKSCQEYISQGIPEDEAIKKLQVTFSGSFTSKKQKKLDDQIKSDLKSKKNLGNPGNFDSK